MLKYINELPNGFRDNLNVAIMNKEFDGAIVDHVINAYRGFELFSNIRILDYEFDENEINYDINNHVMRRNSNKKKTVKNIAETRCGILYIDIEISGLDKNGVREVRYIKKSMVIPIQDEKGYYLIRGKKCFVIYQLVDKMTYPAFGAVTVKSLMPIRVKTTKKDLIDQHGNLHTVPTYSVGVFKTAINVLMVYTHLGITNTLNFMEVHRFIKVFEKGSDYKVRDDVLYFECNKKSDMVVAVKRDIFEKEIYVRSIVGCLVNLFEETKIKFENIDNYEEWMFIVGGRNTISRGRYQHLFYKRLLDDITRKELKINDHDKQNIYYLLRWIIQNFHTLWKKDNLSMVNKRLRCSEYISSFITAEISKRVNQLAMKGDKATMKDYLNALKIPEDIYIKRLHSSGILRYSETYSDMDFGNKFKITRKGPNSLGNTDSRKIHVRQRSLHPTQLGYLDIVDTSSGDPGQSGSLSPYNDMKSLYFDDSLYENEMHYKISKYLDEMELDDEHEEVRINCDNETQYNAMLDALSKYSEDRVTMYGTSINPLEIVLEKDPRDSYRKFNEEYLMSDRIDTEDA